MGVGNQKPVDKPEGGIILEKWVPGGLEEEFLGEWCDAEGLAAVCFGGGVFLNELGDVAPVPDAFHHVLADSKAYYGVLLGEYLWEFVDGVDALLKPAV